MFPAETVNTQYNKGTNCLCFLLRRSTHSTTKGQTIISGLLEQAVQYNKPSFLVSFNRPYSTTNHHLWSPSTGRTVQQTVISGLLQQAVQYNKLSSLVSFIRPSRWLSGQVSAWRSTDLGLTLAFALDLCQVQSYQ